MSGLFDCLNDNGLSMSLYYYGANDAITSFELAEIINNPSFFSDVFSQVQLKDVSSAEDFYKYMLANKFVAMEEILPRIVQLEHKKIVEDLIQTARDALSHVSKKTVIEFLNSHIRELYDPELLIWGVRDVTIELIARHPSVLSKDGLETLCDEHGHTIIDNFDRFEKILEKSPEVFNKLLSEKNLEALQSYRFETILDIFTHIWQKKDSNLREQVCELITKIGDSFEAQCSEWDMRQAMIVEQSAGQYYRFLQKIKHPRANAFKSCYRQIEDKLNEMVQQQGKVFEYAIPVGKALDYIKKIDDWQVRLFALTHARVVKEDRAIMQSHLAAPKQTEKQLIDLISTNILTDDYFSCSHQQQLDSVKNIGTGLLLGIMHDEDWFADYLIMLNSAVEYLAEKTQSKEEKLDDDFILLCNMLRLAVGNRNAGSEALQPLCYSTMMFACAFIEKLLRIVYIDLMKGKQYIPAEKATLGMLLTPNNTTMKQVFGETYIKHLAYFLSQVGEMRIGYNYRNTLAHWVDIERSGLTLPFVATIMWLLTDIVNSMFLYYLGEDKE